MSKNPNSLFGTDGSFPVLCWKLILKYVKEPQDISALSQVSPILKELLNESGAFFQATLQIMLKNREKLILHRATLNTCRLVCQRSKEAVDNKLLQDTFTRFPADFPSEFVFNNSENIQRFLQTFNGTSQMSSFFLSTCCLRVGDPVCFSSSIELLSKHGSHLRHVQFQFQALDIELGPQQIWGMILEQLSHLGNIESLSLTGSLEEGLNGAPPLLTRLPLLPKLKKLELSGLRARSVDGDNLSRNIICFLVTSYGNQLTDFSANETLFPGRFGVDETWNLLRNLKRFSLEMEGNETKMWNNLLGFLEVVHWPNLTELRLGYLSNVDGFISFSDELMKALENFRNSLQVLVLVGRMMEATNTPQVDGMVFPHLTKLCIGNAYYFDPDMFAVFSTRFPNVNKVELLGFVGMLELEWEAGFFVIYFPLLEEIKIKRRDDGEIVFRWKRSHSNLLI
ncbi:unnamed protein product [Orchesella dallaii]|uniref:Uncharacterized protein n=1 Tax=Orchesella dallaii TaxID=48710 RepID=A0ABP1RMF4_9HEXA